MGMVAAGTAFCVAGNHEVKLLKALHGKNVKRSHGLDASMEQLDLETPEFRGRVAEFIDGLISHYVLDGGRLVVAHAGLIERYHGRASGRVREFCLYGQTTGETDEYGLPVRYPWAQEYRGQATVLYGHTPVPAAEWLNNTLCLDTGCVFGGRLTALNYPERTVVSVPAARVYHPPAKPFPAVSPFGAGSGAGSGSGAGRRDPDVLDIGDVSGSRVIETAYLPRVGVRDAHAAAALEVMSRFAIDPRWLLYLPPTMSPVATAARGDLLEHPDQAFGAYRKDGVASVLCEEKHMGSRAVLLVCRSPDEAQARFGLPGIGTVWTRTGRPFFPAGLTGGPDRAGPRRGREGRPVRRARHVLAAPGRRTAAVERQGRPAAARPVRRRRRRRPGLAPGRGLGPGAGRIPGPARGRRPARPDPGPAGQRGGVHRRLPALLLGHRRAGRGARRPVPAARLRRAPSTTSGRTCGTSPWPTGSRAAGPELIATTRRVEADTADPASVAAATRWWEDLTAAGGEGMVVKPAANLTRGRSADHSGRLVQPGLKVRGREYLRIIYGPDYTEPANLTRLRQRGLSHKRSLALREYALGLEALDRVARGEPLWRVHECVFAVLALESEPVDPRL